MSTIYSSLPQLLLVVLISLYRKGQHIAHSSFEFLALYKTLRVYVTTMRVWLLLAGLIFSGDLVQAASLTKESESQTECGVKPDFRGDVGTVTGGNETEKHEYPWMVYVCGEYEYEYEEVEDYGDNEYPLGYQLFF